jgi:hypothetical protein
MTEVFLLLHTHIDESLEGGEQIKIIGVYSSELNAEKTLRNYVSKPGFNKQPDNFEIVSYKLDRDGWVDGFFTTDSSESSN